MTPRLARLLQRARQSYIVWETTATPVEHLPGDSPIIQAAKDEATRFQTQPVVIANDELVVGTPPHLHFGEQPSTPVCFPRQGWGYPYEDDPGTAQFFQHGVLSYAGNHTTLDYTVVLEIGFSGLIARIDERLARLSREEPAAPISPDKADFLRALRIVAEGYIGFCRRYSDLATLLSEQCTDRTRAEELRTIAAHCRRVIAEPPRTFREACQSLWFAFYFLPDAPGRVDYLLYPYYQRDLEQGLISEEEARELLGALWIKYFEFMGASTGVSAFHHLTLGGVQPDGSDASNPLTEQCLDTIAELQLHRPQVALRWHAHMPFERLCRAVRTWRGGTGSPDICNDEQLIPALTGIGVASEDARDYSLSGCQEVIISGKAQMGSVEGFVNLPKILRMALGLEPALFTPAAVEPAAFADFWTAFEEALTMTVTAFHRASLRRDEEAARDPALRASLLVHDCIERVLGYTQGGARYNFCNWNTIGIINTADALMAIKRLVFDERRMTLAEYCTLLRTNWAQQEDVRRQIRRQLPAFGNDQHEVDELAARIITRLDAIAKQYTPYRGGCYILGTTAGGENMHVEFGRVTGATPDGRRDGETLADSIGAAQGRDSKGVTALLNSVAKLPHHLLPTATTLNVKFDPRLLETEEGVTKIAHLIRGHFLTGGQHIQANLLTREQLLDARAHPEEHRNLTVRVTGYSAQFVSLWDDLQDEIIARTVHQMN